MTTIVSNKVDKVNKMSPTRDHEWLEALHDLMHLARSMQRRDMPDDGLQPMEGRALGFFVRHPGSTQSELVLHAGRDKGQIARLIAVLKDKGLLVGEPDAQDRRVMRLYPTDTALQLHARVVERRRQIAARAVTGLSATERQELLRIIGRMQANLRAGEQG